MAIRIAANRKRRFETSKSCFGDTTQTIESVNSRGRGVAGPNLAVSLYVSERRLLFHTARMLRCNLYPQEVSLCSEVIHLPPRSPCKTSANLPLPGLLSSACHTRGQRKGATSKKTTKLVKSVKTIVSTSRQFLCRENTNNRNCQKVSTLGGARSKNY